MNVEKGKNGKKIYVWCFVYSADTFWLNTTLFHQNVFVWEIIITDTFFDSIRNRHWG